MQWFFSIEHQDSSALHQLSVPVEKLEVDLQVHRTAEGRSCIPGKVLWQSQVIANSSGGWRTDQIVEGWSPQNSDHFWPQNMLASKDLKQGGFPGTVGSNQQASGSSWEL